MSCKNTLEKVVENPDGEGEAEGAQFQCQPELHGKIISGIKP